MLNFTISMMLSFLKVIFAKGATYAIQELSQSSYDVISLDWTVPVADARFAFLSLINL